MIRYSSIEEVNAALVELEEQDRIISTDGASSEKHTDSEKPSSSSSKTISANGLSVLNGTEENGRAHNAENDSDSGSDTIDQDRQYEEDLDEENHEDGSDSEDEDNDHDGGGTASDDDDEVHVRQKMTEVDPQEEANFEQELRALMQARVFYYFLCVFLW